MLMGAVHNGLVICTPKRNSRKFNNAEITGDKRNRQEYCSTKTFN